MEYDDGIGELFDVNLQAQRRNRLMMALWPDVQRLDELTNYDPLDWDASRLPAEVRATFPKEWADGHR